MFDFLQNIFTEEPTPTSAFSLKDRYSKLPFHWRTEIQNCLSTEEEKSKTAFPLKDSYSKKISTSVVPPNYKCASMFTLYVLRAQTSRGQPKDHKKRFPFPFPPLFCTFVCVVFANLYYLALYSLANARLQKR